MTDDDEHQWRAGLKKLKSFTCIKRERGNKCYLSSSRSYLSLVESCEYTSGLDNVIGTICSPGNLRRVLLHVHCDRLAVHDQLPVLGLHGTLVIAVDRVILEHVNLHKNFNAKEIKNLDQVAYEHDINSGHTIYSSSMNGSLTATTLTVPFVNAARRTRRPIRPKLYNKIWNEERS